MLILQLIRVLLVKYQHILTLVSHSEELLLGGSRWLVNLVRKICWLRLASSYKQTLLSCWPCVLLLLFMANYCDDIEKTEGTKKGQAIRFVQVMKPDFTATVTPKN